MYLLEKNQPSSEVCLVIHNNLMDRMVFTSDKSYMFPPYQLWMVGYWPTMALTGDGEFGFDSERSEKKKKNFQKAEFYRFIFSEIYSWVLVQDFSKKIKR